MNRLALLAIVALVGCRSSIDLSGGRAYACSRDAGVSGCATGWLCGDDLRCYDPDAGVARPCETAQTGCGGGWKCGFDKVCFDPSIVDGPVRGCSDPALHCPARWLCGFDNTCFDPMRFDGPRRACADPTLHCPQGWRCGIDRLCFDPAAAAADAGARQCTDPSLHCATGERCGVDGLCFSAIESADGGLGRECTLERHCPSTWRCGVEENGRRHCQATGVGGPYPCAADDDCEGGWRCNPVTRQCAVVRDTLEAPPFSSLKISRLGPFDAGGPARLFATGMPGSVSLPGFGSDSSIFTTVASVPAQGNLVMTLWTDHEPRFPDGGVFIADRHVIPFDTSTTTALATLPAEALLLTDAGVLHSIMFSGPPRTLATNVAMLRPSLNMPEVATMERTGQEWSIRRITPISDGGSLAARLPLEPCDAGAVIDFAYASEPGATRAVFLTSNALCFADFSMTSTLGSSWPLPSGVTPRRLVTNLHQGPGAFVQNVSGMSAQSGIRALAIEYGLPDAGAAWNMLLMSDWSFGNLPSLNGVIASSIPPPCSNLCPGDVAPTEALGIAPPPGRADRTLLVRCPGLSSSALNDGGPLPEATWMVSANSSDCRNWRRTRVLDREEELPRRRRVVPQTSANWRALTDEQGLVWLPDSDGGMVLRGLQLDQQIELASRVFLDPLRPRLFLTAGTRQFAPIDGLGVFSQKDFPQSFNPVGAVGGAPTWIVNASGVLDSARFPAGSELPFTVATAPANTTFRSPAFAVEQRDLLFIASQDAVSVGNVARQKASSFITPAVMERAIVPTPGLDIRSLTATSGTDGGLPEAWTVTQGGVYRSTVDGTATWSTQRVTLGGRDSQATMLWSSGEQVRLLLVNGVVLSLPTAVQLTEPPRMSPGRITSSARFCGATWALVDYGAGDAGLFTLGPSAPDGGMASWVDVTSQVPTRSLATSKLHASLLEMLVVSEDGEVLSIEPQLDGGCQAAPR